MALDTRNVTTFEDNVTQELSDVNTALDDTLSFKTTTEKDLNKITATGIYTLPKASLTNLPSDVDSGVDYFILEVIAHGDNNTLQKLYSTDRDSETTFDFKYTRVRESSNWTNWKRTLTVVDLGGATTSEIGRLSGVSDNIQDQIDAVAEYSSYAGTITSSQSWGENQITTFDFSNEHATNVDEVGSTAATKSYKVKKAGRYLIGCILCVDQVSVNDSSQSAYVRAVVRHKASGSSSWDTVQGWRLYGYDDSDQCEIHLYRQLGANDEIRFGIQHGGSSSYQSGTANIETGDVSRAFIMPAR